MTLEHITNAVAHRCLMLGLNVRPDRLSNVVHFVRQAYNNRDELSAAEIDAALPGIANEFRGHFGIERNLSPMQKLELSNARLAAREEAQKPEPTPVSEKDQKRLETMNPERRLEWVHRREAEAAKKKKEHA